MGERRGIVLGLFGVLVFASGCEIGEAIDSEQAAVTASCYPGRSICGTPTMFVATAGRVYCGDTTDGYNAVLGARCLANPSTGYLSPDQTWGFRAVTSGPHTISVTPLSDWDPLVTVLSSCLPSSCAAAADNGGPGEPERVTVHMIEGLSYGIVVDGVENGTVDGGPYRAGAYRLEIAEAGR